MKTWYVYFYRSDNSSEPIGRLQAESIDIARLNAAAIKNLPITEFNKIFDVKTCETELRDENII